MDRKRRISNKITRLSEPSMRLFFIFLIVFAAAALALRYYYLAAAEAAVIILLYVYSVLSMRKKKRYMEAYIDDVTNHVESATKDVLTNIPLPMVIIRLDDNEVLWTNSLFQQITGDREHLFEYRITDVIRGFSGKWLIEGKTESPELQVVGDRKYQLYGNLIRTEEKDGSHRFLAMVYWVDVTEYAAVREKFALTRPAVAIIMLDNYDELRGSISDSASAVLLAAIDEKMTVWTQGRGGLLCRYDRDRYLFVFEESQLRKLTEEKFSLLDEVRSLSVPSGMHPTVSIGIGRGADSFEEAFRFASLGIEMALSRGGDQAIIKNKLNFDFYGGVSMEVEKRTKVKARVVANALGGLISDASSIFIMSHKYADLDSVGAGVGICCIARKLGKSAQIVLDPKKIACPELVAKMQTLPEYENAFIDAQDALLKADGKTLLVIVDTNRPEQVESEALLTSSNHVAVIDHHRRAATYIDNVMLNFHEPYASSACELVAELMEYLLKQSDIMRFEAEAVFSGIVLDTKNFTLRTGSRTFDAAAFLRRAGTDTVEVKKLLQSDFGSTIAKYGIIRNAKMYKRGIAVAAVDAQQDRTIAAQAADELLNISGVFTSFVVYLEDENVNISARSIGKVNVQIILEKLGGGGNKSTAGTQIADKSFEEVLSMLLKAIDDYAKDEKI